MIRSMYLFRVLTVHLIFWLGGFSLLIGSDLDQAHQPNSEGNSRVGMVKKSGTLSVAKRKVINFSLGDKKGQLGFLTSWLPDQNDDLTEVVEGPAAMALDEAGKIYFLDSIREQIQIFNPDGEFIDAKPLPRMGEEFEHAYTDLEVNKGYFLILDTQNYVMAKMATSGRGLVEFLKIPETVAESIPFIVDEFSINPQGDIITQNRYDGSIYQLIHPSGKSLSYGIIEVVLTPPFRAFLGVDSQNRVIGQEFNQQNPSIIDLFRWKTGDSSPEKLFSLPPNPNLFMVDTIGVMEGDPVVAVFTGGEERVRLSEVLRYGVDGTLKSKVKMSARELPWNMNQRYHVHNNHVLVCEYRNFGKRLRVMRYTL